MAHDGRMVILAHDVHSGCRQCFKIHSWECRVEKEKEKQESLSCFIHQRPFQIEETSSTSLGVTSDVLHFLSLVNGRRVRAGRRVFVRHGHRSLLSVGSLPE